MNSIKSNKTFILLLTIGLLLLVSSACDWFPLDWNQWDFGKPQDEIDGGNSLTSEEWSARACSALGEVQIELVEFSEETWYYSDGDLGGTDCNYAYQVTNASDQPLILLYHDHFFYGDNPPPNDYEFGWQKTAPIPSGESWQLNSSASSVPQQPLYLDLISSLAVIYDTPGCAWLTEGGIQADILEIADSQRLQPPCQIIDLASAPGASPDLNQGLTGE